VVRVFSFISHIVIYAEKIWYGFQIMVLEAGQDIGSVLNAEQRRGIEDGT
jgi:hypothetical protein